MKVYPVTSIGSHESPAFVHRTTGCSLERVTVQDYPSEHVRRGQGLREARLAADLSLREAAKALGLGVVEWSGLERGSLTLAENDWRFVHAFIASRTPAPSPSATPTTHEE